MKSYCSHVIQDILKRIQVNCVIKEGPLSYVISNSPKVSTQMQVIARLNVALHLKLSQGLYTASVQRIWQDCTDAIPSLFIGQA